MDARVEIVREISPETGQELVDAFARLLPQLSATARPLDAAAIDRLVACDAHTLLVARTVDLTSRPDRAAANRLYERLGFRARESTVYRFPID
ncbi:hypothetical protein ACFZAM_18345 [Streptomyces sp. NPDC008079]|uniref:hypothetical protein n=1 Tax=Streptomyces sp. NPDC008079 TaxID=3364806 RepID=UPI0036EBA97C